VPQPTALLQSPQKNIVVGKTAFGKFKVI
jgi:hypothetical protein